MKQEKNKNNKKINSNNHNLSNNNLNTKRKPNKLKISIGLIIVCLICIYIINEIVNLMKNPSNSFVVKEGKITKECAEIGYIIRDETTVQGENLKNGMEQIVDEGNKIAKNEAIFRYYSNGEESLKEKIKELDVKIMEVVESNNEDIFSTDTKLLDSQINKQLSNINKLNSVQTIQETKNTINGYVSKKAKIAGEQSPKGSYLRNLIDERSSLENELNSGMEYVKSPASGIVSYRVDGLENVLTTKNLSIYNKEFLNNLNLKVGKIVSTSSETGKIVNNFKCYIACTSKTEEAREAKVGDKVKITIPSTKAVDAKIVQVTQESDNETTLILEFYEGIDELLMYRKISFDIIWWDSYGYKVTNSSIITEDDLNYVIRTKAGYLEKVLVKIKKKGESYSIVTNYSTSEIKELNIKSNVKTSIMLYDELVISPTEEQIKQTS